MLPQKNCFFKGVFPNPKLNKCDINDKNDVNEKRCWRLKSSESRHQLPPVCELWYWYHNFELFTIDKLIEYKLFGANLIIDEAERKEVIPSSFKDGITSLRALKNF